ncbi:hypothetical protein [Streptomyces avicenniae]|uniref:hypothetical protein n=1 Tax=Streptomyces avicenniae TaxID=500153 RepID=UPI00069AA36D|nr:hypothetical protein [Streptomyces avicenniae]
MSTATLRITVHRVRLGRDEFRVIRAADPLVRARLVGPEPAWGDLQMNVDAGAARSIGMLWSLAARSRRSLVYLPLRDGALPAGGPRRAEPPLDLVLLHHSLQFKPHHWKRVRGRLGAGLRGTARLSPADLRGDGEIDHAAHHHREYRDTFHQHVHAHSLFMVGSARVFRETAGMFFDLVRQAPDHGADSHHCEELGHPLVGNGRDIHIEYTRRWTDHQPQSPGHATGDTSS